ncbi:MAG: acyltransferase [Aquisalimonadaceae bacterium]
MKLLHRIRRLAVPSFVVTLWYLLRHRCRISPRAEVEINALLTMGAGTEVNAFSKLKVSGGVLRIGRNVSVSTCCFISASEGGVEIGDYTMVGPNVSIVGNNYRYDRIDVPTVLQEKTSKGIRIADNVWLGAGAVVLDGARIDAGVIVAPNSVVSGHVPENAVVQGNPARVIFTRR